MSAFYIPSKESTKEKIYNFLKLKGHTYLKDYNNEKTTISFFPIKFFKWLIVNPNMPWAIHIILLHRILLHHAHNNDTLNVWTCGWEMIEKLLDWQTNNIITSKILISF